MRGCRVVSCLCPSPPCGWDIQGGKTFGQTGRGSERAAQVRLTHLAAGGRRQGSIQGPQPVFLLLTGKWCRHEKGELVTPGV